MGASEQSPSGQFVTVDGLRLHYRILGKGPKAVVIHGASGNLRDWTAGPAQRLGETHQLLLFDRPGLGFSERPAKDGDDPSVQAALMRKAAGELGFGGAPVVGHSLGGAVALAWALDAPGETPGLLLIASPSQVWEGGVGTLYNLLHNPLTGPLVARALPLLATDRLARDTVARIFEPQSPPRGYLDWVSPRLTLRPSVLRANAADVGNLKGYIREMVPRYGRLTMPVELVHGDTDDTVPSHIHSEVTVATLQNARLTLLPGIGHMPHHTSTGQIAAALARLTR
ncbi:alpha/beta fold hydrolase [Oceanibium sediminis]|uniref:alpha/beta fold hydrolase n=1 Tax=Oceanibium sediminis TaxID=2026339 RepID=UPI0013001707|nr:alpha/beta hydrolase [Oceanibium sediminis]